MSTIGARLRLERERLGLSQTELGERCGVQKRSQINYEKDERAPDATYLVGLAGAGGDVNFVLFGRMSPASLSAEEQRVIALYRLAGPAVRRAVLGALAVGDDVPAAYPQQAAGASAMHLMEPTPTVSMVVNGKVGQQVQVGAGNTGPVVASVGGKKARK